MHRVLFRKHRANLTPVRNGWNFGGNLVKHSVFTEEEERRSPERERDGLQET